MSNSGDKKLHIVATPLHQIFTDWNYGELTNKHHIYLISAHVEPNEGRLRTILKHAASHFEKVANYPEGKKNLIELLPKNKPDYVGLIGKLKEEDEDFKDLFFKEYIEEFGILKGIIKYLFQEFGKITRKVELNDPKHFLFSLLRFPFKGSERLKLLGLMIGIAIYIAWIFLFFITPLISFIGLGNPTLEHFFENLFTILFNNFPNSAFFLVESNESVRVNTIVFLAYFLYIALSFISSIILVVAGVKKSSESEKEGLFGILTGIMFLILSFITSPIPITAQNRIMFFFAVGSIIFLNYVYIMGLSYRRFRPLTIIIFVITLVMIFLVRLPIFLTSTFLANVAEPLSIVIFSISIIFLINFFFNFMKSVELVLELEHGSFLYMGTTGSLRKNQKQKLENIMRIPKEPNPFKHPLRLFALYSGFRPQGIIEFNIELPLMKSKIPKTPEKGAFEKMALFEVTDTVFDGNDLVLALRTTSGYAEPRFRKFNPQ